MGADAVGCKTVPDAVLQEMDMPVIVVDDALNVVLCNRAARLRLRGASVLVVADGRVHVSPDAVGASRLREAAVDAIAHGRQGLVIVRHAPGPELPVAVVPLRAPARYALLIPGRSELCDELSLMCYARAVGLTPSELEILRELCAGMSPDDIAAARRVKLCTVRTQIQSVRMKTGTSDLRGLLHKVARLPALPRRSLGGLAA